MYHMARWLVSSPQPKDRLLDSVVEHALQHGIVDARLREIATAIGTSHRMLIYHFGSREGLLVAVVREVERRERQALTSGPLSPDGARQLWDRLADPAMYAQERLFFEIYARALLNRPETEGFLTEAIDSWTAPIIESMTRSGMALSTARAFAHLGLAVTRGLLLDLLATGDRTVTTQAFEIFTSLIQHMSAGVPEQPERERPALPCPRMPPAR